MERFSLLTTSKILDSCFPAYRQAGAGMTTYHLINENVIPVPARCSASARKRENGNPEGFIFNNNIKNRSI